MTKVQIFTEIVVANEANRSILSIESLREG